MKMTNASSSKMSVEDMIQHYQRSIERSQHDPTRILHCIGKLNRINVTVQHLQSTGIGRTVNVLRKDEGEIGAAAKALISKWKQIVASQESEGEEEKPQEEQYPYEEDESSKVMTESISNSERKSHKTHDHLSRSSSSNSNHHSHSHSHHHHHHQQQQQQQQQQQLQQQQHHHRDHQQPHHAYEHEKMADGHSNKRKYSSDDTQEHSAHSKHKHKTHSRDDSNNGGSRSREHGQENHDGGSVNRHKNSSKHSKDEERHHRSRHEIQTNGDEMMDKKHRHESKHHSKQSNHHKSHLDSTEKMHSSSKHKRTRDLVDVDSVAPKKHKSDPSNLSSRSGEDKKSSSKSKHRKSDDGIEIDHSMGTSFADALGMVAPIPTSSKSDKMSAASTSGKSSSKHSTAGSTSTSSSSTNSKSKIKEKSKPSTSSTTTTPSLLLKKPKLPTLEELNLAKDLPPPPELIIPNDYKPSPVNMMVMECLFKGPKPQQQSQMSETAALCASTTSKNQRTKVYSGIKSGVLLTVPSLHELCIRFLQKNIDALEYTGGVPFEILRPVLERATPEQLDSFENFNPYLMEDSDVLWQQHCQRKFKAYKRQEMETWREMYYRCAMEQEARLNSLTNNIKKSQSVAMPVRQTKLAYVDSLVKPPRNVIKKQHQFGTQMKLTATPAARVEALSSVASNIARPGDARLKALASMRDTAQAQPSNGAMKPKKAPLMAKTLQLMKGRFKR